MEIVFNRVGTNEKRRERKTQSGKEIERERKTKLTLRPHPHLTRGAAYVQQSNIQWKNKCQTNRWIIYFNFTVLNIAKCKILKRQKEIKHEIIAIMAITNITMLLYQSWSRFRPIPHCSCIWLLLPLLMLVLFLLLLSLLSLSSTLYFTWIRFISTAMRLSNNRTKPNGNIYKCI